MTSLYREEAVAFRSNRLEGDVAISKSLPLTIVTCAITSVSALVGAVVISGHYSRTETVAGEVIPISATSKIYADRPGRIIWLGVKDGDVVRQGQPLMTIKIEQTMDDGASPNDARLASIDDQITLNKRQVGDESRRDGSERERLSALVSELGTERDELAGQIGFLEAAVVSTKQTFDSVSTLVEKGFISRSDSEQRRQAWLSAAAQFQAAVQQMSQLAERRSDALAQLAKAPEEHSNRLADLSSALAELQQRRIDARGARGFTITAPVAGRVTSLQAMAGRSSDGRLPLLSIIPQGASMEAALFAPSRAIGMAHPGQAVRLKYDAFPYQRFGSFDGRIIAISRSALAPDEVDAPIKFTEPVYRLRVALDRQTVPAFGQLLALEPGMTLQADVVLDRRTFLDWFLEPIRGVMARK